MNKKRILIGLGITAAFLIVGTAAFIGGRLLNSSGRLPGFFTIGEGGNIAGLSIQFEPAPELPTTQAILAGPFVERRDNSIYVQEISMDSGAQGGVVVSSGSVSAGDSGGPSVQVVGGGGEGPKVEVVITNATLIYKDTTEVDMQPGDGSQVIQQTVEPGSLDELTSMTMVTVWGRKVGDRVIADVLFFSSPMMIPSP